MKSSHRAMMLDQSDQPRRQGPPAPTAIVDGITLVGPSEYSPTESVKHTITDVLSILGNKALRQPGRSEERRLLVEQGIRHRVNFSRMAQRALGDPWADLHDTRRQEFVKLFVELIRDTMANKIDQYHENQILYLDEQRDGRFTCVRTNFIGSKIETSVDFRLERHSGDWLVYDLIIDGASIVKNYRTQFGGVDETEDAHREMI
ncbi:MAG: ABC transporter substrate-binding protein [Nitrospirota bacterium]